VTRLLYGRGARYGVDNAGLLQPRHRAVSASLDTALRIDRNPLIALIFQFRRKDGYSMANATKPQNNPTFESALAELEKIVTGMEAGQMPLEQSLAAYKRGAELLKFCQSALQDAQQQVKILEDGVLKNFGSPEQ
jgi:exodeoxyribonuclease VII small subunit